MGSPENTKNVSLQLEVAPQMNVDSVHYVVTNAAGATVKEGDIPVPGGEETFVFGISLPVGGPYTIALTAGNTTISCAGTTGPFSITSTTQASVTATMICRDISMGDVDGTIIVTSEACPALSMNYAVATPSSAPVDATADPVSSQIAVLSSATDSNGTTPTYTWSVTPAAAGTFTSATSQNTTFNCNAPGAALITVTAAITTTDGACDDTLTIPVSCFTATCGNGVRDAGETCDASAGDVGCPADCTVVCGDGVVEFGETCEPPNTAACSATCGPRTQVCGDGFVNAPETCDDGNTVTGDGCDFPSCTPTPMAACGDAIQQSGEECESPTPMTPFNGNASCSNDCQSTASAACITCENASPCADPSLQLGCTNFPTAAGRTACFNLAECIRDNPTCAATAPEPCYCGALDTATCAARPAFPDPNAPAGPCARQFEAAMETAVPGTVLVNFSNTAVPGSFAVQRVLCDESFCPVCFAP